MRRGVVRHQSGGGGGGVFDEKKKERDKMAKTGSLTGGPPFLFLVEPIVHG